MVSRDDLINDDTSNTILVTAIVTTYNRSELAKRAIQSVLLQTYMPLEIIVIEDGGASDLEDWCKNLVDRKVIYVKHDNNRGLAAARNTGMKIANGKFIAYLDDDDEWLEDRIHCQILAIREIPSNERSKIGVITCGVEFRYPKKNKTVKCPPGNKGILKEDILSRGIITPSSSFLFSKTALVQVGGFDENLPSSIDHDIIMSLATNGYNALAVNKCLVVNYDRSGRNTMMSNTDKRIQGVRLYVDKWLRVYQSWFGEDEGIKYAQNYFVNVIGYLAIDKLISGNFSAFYIAVSEIFSFCPRKIYIVKILAKYCVQLGAGRFLPDKLNQMIKQFLVKLMYKTERI